MTQLLVTTIRRHCPLTEPSGYIYRVDSDRKAVLQRSEMIEAPYRELDDNPRGGMRGSKGIAVRQDEIAIANFSFVFRYDPQWNLVGVLTHPSCSGIHDIQYDGDDLWVTAASADLLLRFDRSNQLVQHYNFRRLSPAIEALGWKPPVLVKAEGIARGAIDFRDPRRFEKETFDRAHVNSLCRLNNRDLFVSLGFIFGGEFANLLRLKSRLISLGIWPLIKSANRRLRSLAGQRAKNMDQNLVVKPARAKSAILQVSPDGRHRLVYALDGITAPSHSLLALPDDSLVYLKTTDGNILHIDPVDGRLISATQVSTAGFLRGCMQLDRSRLLVGDRGALLVYDLNACQVVDSIQITTDATESVYDIKWLPEHFVAPPASFAEHFANLTGTPDTRAYLNR